MCGGGGGSAPPPPPMLPQAPRMPDTSGKQTVPKDKRRRTAGGTILTSSQGVMGSASTDQKTLLGS